jgi:L-2-hydroxyglutarate oxidase LhgO
MMTKEPDVNITIIGAGVIGLAIAAELSKTYKNIFVLERNSKFGQETSSRNSEVIHSGIYYTTNSLKAKLCVEGRKLLFDYCKQKGIHYKKCGKLIVATNKQEENQLKEILVQSQANGVDDGQLVGKEKIAELEPHIKAQAALYFPSTGIIDTYGLMKQLETDSINNGVEFAYTTEVIAIQKVAKDKNINYQIEVKEQQGSYSFTTNIVINASGLNADVISSMVGIVEKKYKLYYWKGEYFGVGNGKNKLINHLIYPVPNKNATGLGIHATIDLSGGMKLGPNAIYLDNKNIEYSINKNHRKDFFMSASSFLPFLKEEDLHPDQAGIRPKLQQPGDTARDFIITEEMTKGFPKFINLLGMESPGLTACIAIGGYVYNVITKKKLRHKP